MDSKDYICLSCIHYEKPNGYGCRAFPEGIPYGYPPNNKHNQILSGQVGNFVYTKEETQKGKSGKTTA